MKIRKNEGESQPFISVMVSYMVMVLFCSGFFIEKFSSKGQQKIGISCFSPLLGCKCSLLTALYLLNSIVGFKVLFQLYSFLFVLPIQFSYPPPVRILHLTYFLLYLLYTINMYIWTKKKSPLFPLLPEMHFFFFFWVVAKPRGREKKSTINNRREIGQFFSVLAGFFGWLGGAVRMNWGGRRHGELNAPHGTAPDQGLKVEGGGARKRILVSF